MEQKPDNQAKRYDDGKAPMHLLPWDALIELSHIYGKGALKYGERNWERGMDWHRVFNSLVRHAAAWNEGEDMDQESGQHHMLHVAWNALTLFAYHLRGVGVDTREGKLRVAPALRHAAKRYADKYEAVNLGEIEGLLYDGKGGYEVANRIAEQNEIAAKSLAEGGITPPQINDCCTGNPLPDPKPAITPEVGLYFQTSEGNEVWRIEEVFPGGMRFRARYYSTLMEKYIEQLMHVRAVKNIYPGDAMAGINP